MAAARARAMRNLGTAQDGGRFADGSADVVMNGWRFHMPDLAAAVEARSVAGGVGGAAAVALWVRGDREAHALLLERGYTGAPEPHLRLSAIAFDSRVSVPQVLTDFYLTMGDSDHF